MKGRSFELLCVVLLGLGQMSIMTGYDTQSFVQESVIHSVHERNPSLIGQFAGYYGQATCYAAYMIGCIFAPIVMSHLGPKRTLFLSSLCFTAYQAGFFYLNNYYYYISCAIMGLGFALYYTANGGYLTSHSTRQTVEQNSAIAWAIACICMICGGGILSIIFSFNDSDSSKNLSNITTFAEDTVQYRKFSDSEIFWMYLAFTLFSVIANIIFFLIPSKEIENCIEGHVKVIPSLKSQLNLMLKAFIHPNMLILSISFIHLGFYTAFWVSVYPTAIIFTQSLHEYKYIVAIYSIAVGCGEIAMGFIISFMSHRINNFCLKPAVLLSLVGTIILAITINISTPQWATIHPTAEKASFIQPSMTLIMIISFFLGMVDSCVNNARLVICALAMPNHRAQSFSISKFYQALGGALLMVLSPYLSITHYTIILITTIVTSSVLFLIVANKMIKSENKALTNKNER